MRTRWTAACLVASLIGSSASAQSPIVERASSYTGLSDVELLPAGSSSGFELFVQPPIDAEEGFLAETQAGFLPWLEEVERILREDYLVPAGIAPTAASVPVILLASEADYRKTLRAKVDTRPGGRWEPELGAVIGYQDCYKGKRPAYRQRGPILRDAVIGFLDAYSKEGTSKPGSEWLVGGLAQMIGYHFGRKPSCLPDTRQDSRSLSALYQLLGAPKSREAYWLDLEALLSPKTSAELKALPADWFLRRLGEGYTVNERVAAAFDDLYRKQAHVWVEFLHRGLDGRHAVHVPGLLAAALEGKLNQEALLSALDVAEPDLLVEQFHGYLDDQFLAALKLPPVALVPPTVAEATSPKGAADAAGQVEPAEASFAFSEIRLKAESGAELVGFALNLARMGQLEAALERLAIPGFPLDEGESAVVARVVERLQAVAQVRSSWVSKLVAEGGNFRVTLEGKRRAFKVTGQEDGQLLFQPNRHKVASWPMRELNPGIMLLNLERKWDEHGDQSTLALLQALTGDIDWEITASKASEPGKALLADMEDHDWMLRTGAYIGESQWLAGQEMPSTLEELDGLWSRLLELRVLGQDLSVAAEHGAICRRYGAALLQQRCVLGGPGVILHGETLDLGEGRVRVTYSFDRDEEVRDFEGQLGEILSRRPQANLGVDVGRRAYVNFSSLWLLGTGAFVHPLPFTGEVTIRFRCGIYRQPEPATGFLWFRIGAHWDPKNRRMFSALTGRGLSVDFGEGQKSETPTSGLFPPSERVDSKWIEIHFDGAGTYSLSYDGEVERSFEGEGGPSSGQAFLVFHSDYAIALGDLVVEGRIDPAKIDATYERWAERQLQEMNF